MQISVCLFARVCACVCESEFQFKRCGVCRLSAFPPLGGAIHLNFPVTRPATSLPAWVCAWELIMQAYHGKHHCSRPIQRATQASRAS